MGTLFLVATPIGNLEDITQRAINTFSEVNLVLAEDTRNSGRLMRKLNLTVKMKSYHDFNKEKVTPSLIEQLKGGDDIALITDAGTPAIADPGFYIVREAIINDIEVVTIPGPTAFVTALASSGLPTDRFIFENFLPSKGAKRKQIFTSFKEEKRTVIFYETPHRIKKVLKEMNEVIPDTFVVVARELTKLHEEFLRGTPKELYAIFEKKPPKGEMVILFNPSYQPKTSNSNTVS